MPSFFDTVRYGWNVVYAIEIEGVPVLWSESATGHAPAGYTEALTADGEGALVIDRSGEVGQLVDRETGIGVGQPLTFQLRHCPSVETYLRRYVASANLTADLTPGAGAATVDSTASFGGAGTTGVLWCEKEAITYTVLPDGTTFTLTGRGAFGSLRASHSSETSARLITDLPRWWRGRQARLWAYATDPTGYVCSDRVEVWRGHISTGPERNGTAWQFEALSLDRRLADDVLRPASGTVVDTMLRWPVYKSDRIDLAGEAPAMAGGVAALYKFECQLFPFSSYVNGEMLTREQQINAIQAAWASAKTTTTNSVTGLQDLSTWLGSFSLMTAPGGISHASLGVTGLQTRTTYWSVSCNGYWSNYGMASNVQGPSGSLTLWVSLGQLVSGAWSSWKEELPAATGPAITLELADPDSSPASSGWLIANDQKLWYGATDQFLALCTFYDLRTSPDGKAEVAPAGWTAGTEVQITSQIGNTAFPSFALTLLESSGDGTRGNYDTLPSGAGYGFDGTSSAKSAINEASFNSFGAPGNGLICHTPAEETASFESICGGMLAAQQCAVVPRRDSTGAVRLHLVDVSTLGTAFKCEVTDADLLTSSAEPVTSLSRRTVPSAVVLTPTATKDGVPFTAIDAPLVKEQGRSDLNLDLPVPAIPSDVGLAWATSILQSSQTAQAIEIRLPPWIDVHPGDLIKLDLSHYGVWSWSTGEPGYTGTGRIVGTRMDLQSLSVVATVLIDAAQSSSLSPAAMVVNMDDPVSPGEIFVQDRYLPHFAQTLALGGSFRLQHYIPGDGDEAGGGEVVVSDVQDAGGGLCALTIASSTLGYDLQQERSYLTLPLTASCTTFQASFSHDGDGTRWL